MSNQTDEKPVAKIKEKAHQVAQAESAPPDVRRYRAIWFQTVLFLIGCGFAVLTFLVKTMPSFAIDLQITKAIQLINFPAFAFLMDLLSWPGFAPQIVVVTAIIVLIIYGLGLHWEAVAATFAALFSTAVNVIVKDLVQRPRPSAAMVNVLDTLNSYSFPSGHVMYYLGFFGFVGFLVFSLMKPSYKRGALLVLFGAPVVLIGVSRIYLGEHWPSDVLGAYLLGSLTLMAIIQFYRWGKKRFFVHQPVAAGASQQPA